MNDFCLLLLVIIYSHRFDENRDEKSWCAGDWIVDYPFLVEQNILSVHDNWKPPPPSHPIAYPYRVKVEDWDKLNSLIDSFML